MDKAIAEDCSATADSTGKITVVLTTLQDNAKISALEVFQNVTPTPPDPNVTVSLGTLGDVFVGYPVTTTASASVDTLPGGYSASDLVATWSYDWEYIDYSATGNDDDWDDASDGSTAGVTLNGATTDPAGTFTGTFNTEGYYEVCISATVSYHNPTTGENFGPYTGYGYVDSNNDSGGSAPSAQALHGISPDGAPTITGHLHKVKVGPITPTIAIDGLSNSQDPGGLVIPNRDGNGALRQKITIDVPNAPSGWTSDSNNAVVITNNANSKIDIYTSASDVQPLSYGSSGNTNVFPASSLPLTLYVAGTNPSTTMRDIQIIAQATSHGKAGGVSKAANFTVLWVDNVRVRLTSDAQGAGFSPDDGPPAQANGDNYGVNGVGGPQVAGNTANNPFSTYCWTYEGKGQVSPANFDYPYTGIGGDHDNPDNNYNRLHLARDVEAHYYFDNNVLQPDPPSKEWSVYPALANDTDLPTYQTNVVSPQGNIYAIDDPGINVNDPDWAVGEVRRLRFNAREFAEIRAQGKPTRCSLIAGFYVRLSVINMGNGDFEARNDQANDNKAGSGVTSVTAGP